MAFKVEKFSSEIARSLLRMGFRKTSVKILEKIETGKPALPRTDDGLPDKQMESFSPWEQQQICADMIEQNIILRYALWEASALLISGQINVPGDPSHRERIDELIQILDNDGSRRLLGSFEYRAPIEGLVETVKRLRGLEPPPPPPPSRGTSGGGSGQTAVAASTEGGSRKVAIATAGNRTKRIGQHQVASKIENEAQRDPFESRKSIARFSEIRAMPEPMEVMVRRSVSQLDLRGAALLSQDRQPFAKVSPSTISGREGQR